MGDRLHFSRKKESVPGKKGVSPLDVLRLLFEELSEALEETSMLLPQ